MVLLTLALTAAADDRGFEPVREANDCVISMRPEGHPEGAAMRAECQWREIAPERLVDLLGSYERYPDYVYAIAESRVVRTADDGRALVYQRQSLWGIADREVLLWMWREQDSPAPAGPDTGGAGGAEDFGVRFSWTTAADEPLVLRPGAVRTPRNVGFWRVAPDLAGGSMVVHEIQLDAGGSVPRWLVALVRTRGFARVMADVRALAAEGA